MNQGVAQKRDGDLRRQIGATFVAKAAVAIFGLAASVVIARSLGPEGRGQFAAAMAIAGIGMQVANLGLHSSNTYFVAKDPQLLRALIANSVVVSLGGGIVMSGAIAITLHATKLSSDVGGLLAMLALLWIPVGLCYMLLQNLLLGTMAIAAFNRVEIVLKVLNLAFVLLLLFVGAKSAAQFFLAGLVALLCGIAMVWQSLGEPLSSLKALSLGLLSRQIPYALRSYLASLFAFLLMRFDVLMLQHFSGNEEVGQYAIAVSMADILYMLPAAAGVVLFSKLSGTAGTHARRTVALKVVGEVAAIMTALGIVAVLIAPPVVRHLFGPSFLPAVPMFNVLVPAIVVYGLNNILSNHLAAEGMPWSAVYLWVVAFAVNVILNLLWIPERGGVGAAYATLVAYSMAFVIQIGVILLRKEVTT